MAWVTRNDKEMTMLKMVLGLAVLGLTGVAMGQAPAGAPAGTMGICKDGTYSTQAKKEGACRGHKGVQTWYAASTTAPAMPAPTPASAVPVKPAPTPTTIAPSRPAPLPTPATPVAAAPAPAAASAAKKQGPAAAAAAKTAAPGGGPGLVWVNTESKVYHCNGDTYYGKTKQGSYMTEAAAQAAGAHGERGKSCAGK